jgi:amidase
MGTISEFSVTRTVRDTAALLDAVEGPGWDEVRTVAKPESPYLQEVGADCGKLQVAVWTESMIEMPVHPEVATAVNSAANALKEMGHSVDDADFRFDYSSFQEKDAGLTGVLVAAWIQHFAEVTGKPLDEAQFDGITRGLLDGGRSVSGQDIYGALEAYNILRHSIYEFFNSWDVLLTPTITMLPEVMPVENDTYFSWGRYCQFLLPPSVSGNPCISLPLGMSKSGLPIGVQLVTRFGDEATLFRVAGALEEAMPWRDRVPQIHVSR